VLFEGSLHALGTVGRLRRLIREQADLLGLHLPGEPRHRLARTREAQVRALLAEQVRRARGLLGAPLGVDVPNAGPGAALAEKPCTREEQDRDRQRREYVVFRQQRLDLLAIHRDLVVALGGQSQLAPVDAFVLRRVDHVEVRLHAVEGGRVVPAEGIGLRDHAADADLVARDAGLVDPRERLPRRARARRTGGTAQHRHARRDGQAHEQRNRTKATHPYPRTNVMVALTPVLGDDDHVATRDSSLSPSLATQRVPSLTASALGSLPTATVRVTRAVAGSMRATALSSTLATHTAPSRPVRTSGRLPTRIVAVTASDAGSIRTTERLRPLATQTVSSVVVTADGERPTGIVATTELEVGSMRETVPSLAFATQTAPKPTATP